MDTPPKHLVGYARVSMNDQNPALQVDALRSFGVALEDIHTDQASGGKRNRPGLDAALKDLRRGDVLVVWKLDRLARSLMDLIDIVKTIERKGAHLRCLTQPIDTTTPGGTLIFHIFGAVAEFERGMIRERTVAGLAAAAARGRKGGRRSTVTPEMREQAMAMLAAGASVRETHEKLKVSRALIYRWKSET
jgi:DNA invertase Pin-like site-specific DNA recombinase